MRIFICVAALFLTFTAVADNRGLLPTDFYKEIIPSDTAVSPDGSLVAFTVTTVDEKANKRHQEIWMQRIENGAPIDEPFRFSSPKLDSSSPVWSPDGSVLSFQSRRGDDKNSSWFIRVTSPGGEAYHIEGVEAAPVWSPDGDWIAYTKRPDGEEEDEEAAAKEDAKREGWIAPDALTTTLDAKRFDGRVITTMQYKSDGTLTLLPHRSARKKAQLFVVPAAGGDAKQITNLPHNVSSIEWTADSDTILFTADPKEDDDYNKDLTSEIFGVSRFGGVPTRVSRQLGAERGIAISRDGSRMAYLFTPDRGKPTDLMLVDIHYDGCFNGEPTNLTANWDLSPGAPEWSPDGRSLRFVAGAGGNVHVFEVDAAGGPVRQVTQGERYVTGVSYSDDHAVMAFATTDPVTPAELAVARADGSNERRFTHFNDEWLSDVDLMPAERLTWQVADGTPIEGWVIKPVGFDRDKTYPMILKIHGGPHSAYGNTWFRTFHVLSEAGFFVLYTNPRGSSGYGHDFMYATRGRWGEMDQEDYLTGVDAAVAKYRQIDPNRVGVSGGSYGGFMTGWLTATTDRFAAANPSRMIVNWESWYGASDAQRLTEWEFFGAPWEERDLYRKLSPLNFVENVVAPTLIIHSENDYRTPIADGEQWYMALKKRGVPVELIRYPRSSHGLSRTGEPWLLVDRLERIKSWFTHWLIEEELTHEGARKRYTR